MTAAEAFNLIMSGSILEGVILPYTDIMGMYFYGLVLFIGMFLIYMKTQSFDTTTIVGLVMSGLLIVLVPESFHRMIYILLAIGITAILYRVTH